MPEHIRRQYEDDQHFTQVDIDKLEQLNFILGRCLEIVNKVEQLHAMKYLSLGLDKVNS